MSGPAVVLSAKANENNSSNVPTNRQKLLDSNTRQHPQLMNKTSSPTDICDADPETATAASLLLHSRSCSDKLKDKEVIIESGRISISTIYSQGLSSALTQALRRSSVDLLQANISVKIDFGKRTNTSTLDINLKDQSASTWEEESGEAALKRLKTSI